MVDWVKNMYCDMDLEEKKSDVGNSLIDRFLDVYSKIESDNNDVFSDSSNIVEQSQDDLIEYAEKISECSTFEIWEISDIIAKIFRRYYEVESKHYHNPIGHVIYLFNDIFDPIILGDYYESVITFYSVDIKNNGEEIMINIKQHPLLDRFPILIPFINTLVQYRMKKDLYNFEDVKSENLKKFEGRYLKKICTQKRGVN